MNILYVCHKDPRLLVGGNEIRTHWLWLALKQKGDVYTLVLRSCQTAEIEYDKEDHRIVFINPSSKGFSLNRIVYAMLGRLSGVPVFPIVRKSDINVKELFPIRKYDLVVARYIYSFKFFHLWNYAPVLVDFDDSPEQVYNTLICLNLPRLFRSLGLFLVKWQTKYVNDRIFGGWLSNNEQLNKAEKKISYLPNIPNLPNLDYLPALKNEKMYLLTLGVMSYTPNYSGVNRFVSEVWPTFYKNHPNVRYVIGGKDAPAEMVTLWNSIPGVQYVGFIDDLEDAYRNCIATIIPIYSGGGTCIKTLESLSYFRVCLSTPFGTRGIAENIDKDDVGILVFNNVSEFEEKFLLLLDSNKRTRMELSARSFIDQNYSFDVFKNNVNSQIQRLEAMM